MNMFIYKIAIVFIPGIIARMLYINLAKSDVEIEYFNYNKKEGKVIQ